MGSDVGCVDPNVWSVYGMAVKEAGSRSMMGISSVPINSPGDADKCPMYSSLLLSDIACMAAMWPG